MEIEQDTKIFLRSVLVTQPGMKQSQIMKEYYDTTDEKLDYAKHGFQNIYHFLRALEGEITRLEFSPQHGENLVYAVLDKSKYASNHAKKYADKSKTGLPSKSPEEIIRWRKEEEQKGRKLPPVFPKKVPQNKRLNDTSRRFTNKRGADSKDGKDGVFDEWAALKNLLPERDDVFTLSVKNIGVKRSPFNPPEKDVCAYFALYNSLPGSVKIRQDQFLISFGSFFNAYRAWKEKHRDLFMGRRLGVLPTCGDISALSTAVHYVIVKNIPKCVVVSTFVTKFARFGGLVSIDKKAEESSAVVGYSKLLSAQRACTDITRVKVKESEESIRLDVQLVPDLSSHRATNEIAADPVDVKFDSLAHVEESSINTESRCATPSVASTQGDSQVESGSGFALTYNQWEALFQETRKRKPKTRDDFPNEIKFLVTYQCDCLRFWGWILKDNETAVKLQEIEKKIAESATKIQPPTILPKPGNRGAAMFGDSWYRCFVLSIDETVDELKVFYCDYGNTDNISRKLFRSTYSDVWTLDPQATPFKFHGYEVKEDANAALFYNLHNGQVLKAKIVKETSHSEAHIIELREITMAETNICLDQEIIGNWCVAINELKKDKLVDKKKKKSNEIDSVFDYNEEELVLGLLYVAYNPGLIYLKLGDMNQFHQLQMDLVKLDLCPATNLGKGNILLSIVNNERRRVMVLHVDHVDEKIKVLHVDYGVIEWVHINNLFELAQQLQNSPFQARPANLAGIDCKATLSEASNYLINKSRIVVKANVLKESKSGKITVELFDVQRNVSLNKEMLDKGLAMLKQNEFVSDTDEEVTADNLVVPIQGSTVDRQKGILSPPMEKDIKIPNSIAINQPALEFSKDIAHHLNRLNLEDNDNVHEKDEDKIIKEKSFDISEKFQEKSFDEILEKYRVTLDGSNPNSSTQKLQDVSSWVEGHHLKESVDEDKADSQKKVDFSLSSRCEDVSLGDIIERDISKRVEDIPVILNDDNISLAATEKSYTSNQTGGNDSTKIHQAVLGVLHNEKDMSFPQPDIVASNLAINFIDNEFEQDTLAIKIGDEVFCFQRNIKPDPNQLNRLRYRWQKEKNDLIEIQKKLGDLLGKSQEELDSYYREAKKEKLLWKLRVKKSQKDLLKLEKENASIIEETNKVLSSI